MRLHDVLDPVGLLGPEFPLPLDRPFTYADARGAGLGSTDLTALVRTGALRHPLNGVYLAAQAPDTLRQRVRTVRLVLPSGAVVTDRTAAYLHGVEILPRTALTTPPAISVFRAEGTRLRRAGVASGLRTLLPRDIMEIGGIPVTTPLRTVCDLGRLLWRYDALAAIDLYLRHGVPHAAMLEELPRYAGYRWVRQLRALVPLGDARAESPGESALRLHWYDAGLPPPDPQHWVHDDAGVLIYRLDLTLPALRYAAEYDGEEFHSEDVDRAHDEERRSWLRKRRGWHIEVFTKESVYGMQPDPLQRLAQGAVTARRNCAQWDLNGR